MGDPLRLAALGADAKSQQTVLTYDWLGRLLTKTSESGLATPTPPIHLRPGAHRLLQRWQLTTAANAEASITYD
jgi:hypothetical protein